MKLLIDEMWAPRLAEELRRRGHDVVAVAERPQLRGETDAVVLAVALAEGRAVFTDNISDFVPLIQAAIDAGRSHPKLILTSYARYPRQSRRTFGRVVSALDALLSSEQEPVSDVVWLR